MTSNNSTYDEEQQRVNHVIKTIDEKAEKTIDRSTSIKESVIELRKNFWEDVTVNIDEPDDVIETQASIKQQAELLTQKEQSHGKLDDELKTLKRLRESPYFGRIDFHEDTEQTAEPIYIGIASLMDGNNQDFLIYDWRAPISSLYYDYSPGEAQYETMEETINGEITLKRQFIIRQGLIKGMFDTGVTIGDRLLQEVLGNNASTKMKSIVATIQKEQNRIIRNKGNQYLVVQGAAGSGKTSAALQRIAYLMYAHRDILGPDNIVLLSPNPLFSSYIANVLPELGETNVRQTTFLDYLEDQIRHPFTIESPFEQMEYVMTEKQDNAIRMQNIDCKSDLTFMRLIDAFIDHLNKQDIQFRNITFRGEVLISKEQIRDYFYSLDETITIPNKLELVAKWLLQEIREKQRNELDKDWVLEKTELLDKEDYQDAFHQSQEQAKHETNETVHEESILRKEVVKRVFAPIKKKIKAHQFVHAAATYQQLFTNWTPDDPPVNWEAIRTYTAGHLAENFLPWEDAAAYLYFQYRLLGTPLDRSVRYLVVDEAQDYAAFQFTLIKHIFPNARMTLLGDINQAIYSYMADENPLVSTGPGEASYEKITLTKSYRSTRQIAEFTIPFAPGSERIEPFNREGNKPLLIRENKEHLAETLAAETNRLYENGSETIGIICKTQEESNQVANLLKDKIAFTQIDESTGNFSKGLLILPVYLAKGIEMDAVIIPDASADKYDNETDRTLFYTACTRAMHELVMVSAGDPAPFISEAPQETYREEQR
ncbi:RNA polymerase recycling motor HelD [Lentibacillus cibarius]|uniref:Helicase n=1 Tax=Lentibacillus cibarius TaxID=2583219 RepID=A0A5S3QMK6_9BACI|nr:RNA polymerase recycling motor HelD [Lentibacillus cibarius]TMN22967.1 helicase [Lentibacillus cibarius]